MRSRKNYTLKLRWSFGMYFSKSSMTSMMLKPMATSQPSSLLIYQPHLTKVITPSSLKPCLHLLSRIPLSGFLPMRLAAAFSLSLVAPHLPTSYFWTILGISSCSFSLHIFTPLVISSKFLTSHPIICWLQNHTFNRGFPLKYRPDKLTSQLISGLWYLMGLKLTLHSRAKCSQLSFCLSYNSIFFIIQVAQVA